MALVESNIFVTDLPRGLSTAIKNQINLAGEIKSCYYKDKSDFENWQYVPEEALPEDCNIVDMSILYYIDEDMKYTFEAYVENWINKQIKLYNAIEKCWSIPNE